MEIILSKDIECILLNYLEFYKVSKDSNKDYRWTINLMLKDNIKWSKEDYEKILENLDDKFINISDPEDTLVVTSLDNGFQYEIKGLGNITKYCLSENPECVPGKWIKVEALRGDILPNNEFPLDVVLHVHEQTQINGEDIISKTWTSMNKHYRLYKKYSFKNEKDNIIYNITINRQNDDIFKSMKEANISSRPIEYDFDIEFVQTKFDKDHNKKDDDRIIETIISHVLKMIQILKSQLFPLSKSQQDEVLEEYDELIKLVYTPSKYSKFPEKKDENSSEGSSDSKNRIFLAPKSISLEKKNIVTPGANTYGVNSILSNYTVTDKADGERMLMYINNNGEAFLINDRFEVFDTGLRTKAKNIFKSLIDGEFINTFNKIIYAAFDIYFLNKEPLTSLPLINGKSVTARTRYGALKQVCDKKIWNNTKYIEFRCKDIIFAEGNEMKKACKNILENVYKLGYKIDGLIFTPAEVPVYGYYPGKPVPIKDNAKWEKSLKWKPPEQNSIDFLVEYAGEVIDTETKIKYGRLKLKTGFNLAQWEPISPFEGLKRRYDKKYKELLKSSNIEDQYRAELFKPFTDYHAGVEEAWIELDDNGRMVCHDDGSIIEDKSIVEFTFNPDLETSNISMKWNPLRVRNDKTKKYQKYGKISKTANDYSVATSIWRLIHNPVTVDYLIGVEEVPESELPDNLEERLLSSDDTYYAREIPRQHMLSLDMLNFHNQGIKKNLYQKGSDRSSLLELACGMAGDMYNWRDAGYMFVLGIDYVENNITKAKDGAYARMLSLQDKAVSAMVQGELTRYVPDIIFAIGDCSLPLENGDAAGENDESKALLKVLFDKKIKVKEPHLQKLNGLAQNKFSVVSCQFAIHYFFQSEEKLDGFLRNVAHNLKRGGIFIATFMDGQLVHKELEASPTPGLLEGRKINGRFPVWAIIKRYGSFDDTGYYGKTVDVFLENTNKIIPEFLVNLNTLREKANNYGMVLDSTGLFSEDFENLLAKVPKDPYKRKQLDKSLLGLKFDEVQKKFSFLNRWVVFKMQ